MVNSLSSSDIEIAKDALIEVNVRKDWSDMRLSVFLSSIIFIFTSDLENGGNERVEVLAVTCDNIALTINRADVSEYKITFFFFFA